MIPELVKHFLNSFHNKEINQLRSVAGGSINEAYRYSVDDKDFFVKYNNEVEGIIKKEVEGLKAIAELKCIATPDILVFKECLGYEILVLSFVSEGMKTKNAWKNFGQQLAEMHSVPAPYFGWHQSNFIGSLPQSNKKTSKFIDFFINQRLRPQIELAQKQDYFSSAEINQFEKLFKKLNEILPDSEPSLVHGDLWSGNFMIGENDTPFLIDPSIHYNFRETDLAFTYLFGGFDSAFYDAYQYHLPLEPQFKNRISLYNLYPLLVHLNLFGRGYYNSVMNNLNQYFG